MLGKHDMTAQLREWVFAERNPPSIAYVVLSAAAAVISYAIARHFCLPEPYWAPMATVIVMQVTLSATFPVAVQYVMGTAVGAAVGAATDMYFHPSVAAFGAAIVLVGLLCVAFRIEGSAFRYASITFVIVTLVPRSTSNWLVALNRFFEVSIGTAGGLVLFAIWQKIDLKFPVKVRHAPSAGS